MVYESAHSNKPSTEKWSLLCCLNWIPFKAADQRGDPMWMFMCCCRAEGPGFEVQRGQTKSRTGLKNSPHSQQNSAGWKTAENKNTEHSYWLSYWHSAVSWKDQGRLLKMSHGQHPGLCIFLAELAAWLWQRQLGGRPLVLKYLNILVFYCDTYFFYCAIV